MAAISQPLAALLGAIAAEGSNAKRRKRIEQTYDGYLGLCNLLRDLEILGAELQAVEESMGSTVNSRALSNVGVRSRQIRETNE